MTELDGGERFDFGRVVGLTLGLIGRNFVMFAVLSVIFVGVPQFGVSYVQGLAAANSDFGLMSLASFGGIVVSALAAFVLQGAVTRAAVDDLSKSGVSFGAALVDGLRFFFPLFIVGLLAGIGIFLGFLLLIIPGIILALRWSLTAPVVVIERIGPTSSMGRSADLTENHRWAIFGLFVLYVLLAYAVQSGLLMSYSAFGGSGSSFQLLYMDARWLTFVAISAVVSALVSLISTVGTAVVYFELRRVKEGVGIDELAKVFD